ncbi:hypothetical protein [Streptomyces sp. NPDC056660]|uniref:hypothetical protein n=1 Tax=Streptomyces sp. NPDC056660 TaxID=3345897 RepID=UPI0036A8A3E0
MTSAPHTEHGIESLCAAGTELYERALVEGHISARDATEAPCLVDLGLLHPTLDDLGRLEPVAPAIALNRLLRATRADAVIAHRPRPHRQARRHPGQREPGPARLPHRTLGDP